MVLPLLSPVADSNDEDVCCRAVQLLVSVLSDSTPQWAPPIIGIINTVSRVIMLISLVILLGFSERIATGCQKS